MGSDKQQQHSDPANANDPAQPEEPARPTKPTNQEGWHPEEKDHRGQERRYWLATTILTGVAAAGAIATTILSLGALTNSQDSADSARKSVVEAQRQANAAYSQIESARDISQREARAYVVSNSVRLVTYGNHAWEVTAIIENLGNTPTKLLRLGEGLTGGDRLILGEIGAKDAEMWNGTRFLRLLIGPKTEIYGSKNIMPSSEMTRLTLQNAIGAYGLARYQDVFGGHHIYEFCFGIRLPRVDYDNFTVGTPIRVQGFPCQQHNCSDEECGPDWEQRAKQ